MSNKDVSQKQVEELIKELGADAMATITMGQLQHMVNEKNAAEERIKELEANQVVCAAGCRERKELLESKVKIKQLEAQVERLKFGGVDIMRCLKTLAYEHNHDDVPRYQNLAKRCMKKIEEAVREAPAQSLKAKNWEAAEKLDQIVDSD